VLVVQVQLFVMEVVARFKIVGFTAIGCPGFPISDYGDSSILDCIYFLINHGFVAGVGAYC